MWNEMETCECLRSDFPVEGKPHSYALPTIYSWSLIKSGQADGESLHINSIIIYHDDLIMP